MTNAFIPLFNLKRIQTLCSLGECLTSRFVKKVKEALDVFICPLPLGAVSRGFSAFAQLINLRFNAMDFCREWMLFTELENCLQTSARKAFRGKCAFKFVCQPNDFFIKLGNLLASVSHHDLHILNTDRLRGTEKISHSRIYIKYINQKAKQGLSSFSLL